MAPIQVDILSNGMPLITGGWRNSSSPEPTDPYRNLVVNGSFEETLANDMPANWNIGTQAGTVTIGVDTTSRIDDAQSLAVTATGSGNSVRLDSELISVEGNALYAYDYFLRGTASGGTCSFAVYWFQQDGTTAASRASDSVSMGGSYLQTTWNSYHKVLTAPANAAFARISLNAGQNTTRWDAISFRKCDTAIPQGGTVLASGSFENAWTPYTRYQTPESQQRVNFLQDNTAPDGQYVADYVFPSGEGPGLMTDSVAWYVNDAPNGNTEILVEFYMRFSEGFNWGASIQKLAYFAMGTGKISDANPWLTNHILGADVDIPFTQTEPKGAVCFALQHSGTGANQQLIAGGDISLLTTGVWHKLTMYLKRHDSGKFNGLGKIWLDGVLLVDSARVMWSPPTTAGEGGLFNYQLNPIRGGSGPTLTAEQHIGFDSMCIVRGPFA